jgi:large subunit ribosomal protein L1
VAGPRWPTEDHTFRRNENTMQRSKTYRAAADTFDKDELYAPLAAR